MTLKIFQVDAFTNSLFKGNYAAVVFLDTSLEKELMQKIALENNLSETAFIIKKSTNTYEIRWFSPINEIDFCGHATLASAFVIFQEYNIKYLSFETLKVGTLDISLESNNFIKMSFPNQEPKIISKIPKNLSDALNIKAKEILQNRQAYFIICENENDVYKAKPNLELLKTLFPYDVVFTSKSRKYDFVSRYFWPANGGDEDPVTGSIHTGLAPYWAKQLNKNELFAFQASKRGGELLCKVQKDKVIISGQAILYMQGYINI